MVELYIILPLAIYCGDQVTSMMELTPWKKKEQLTAGRVRLGLQNILRHVRVRDWLNPKYRKFQTPDFQQYLLQRTMRRVEINFPLDNRWVSNSKLQFDENKKR